MNESMRADLRAIGVTGEIVFPTGASAELDEIISVRIEEGTDGALLPGSVLSARYSVALANDSGQWREGGSVRGTKPIVGSTVKLFLNTLPMGVFKVDSVSAQERSGRAVLLGCDSIASELGGAFKDLLTYPSTLQAIWAHFLGQTRYVFSGAIPNGDAIVDSAPDWGGTSLRRVAGLIAQAAGCFVRVNRSGGLEMVKCAGKSVGALTADDYFSLDDGFDSFGPVQAVSIVPTGEEEAMRYGGEMGEALEIEGNPLFIGGTAHLNALCEGMLEQIQGLEWTRAAFVWRGDPALEVGMRVSVRDSYGSSRECVITRQTLTFDGGFSSAVECAIPKIDLSGVPRAITPEGGLNADRLIGAVDGGLLRAGSVVARALAAGSVTAEKLAVGAVSADSIQASAITADKIASGALTAEEIRALTAHLSEVTSGKITTDALYAALVRVQALAANEITADTIQTDELAAALGKFVSLYAGTGEFDLAAIENLLSSALVLKSGVADSMMIANLAVTSANLLNATIDKLVLKGSDGKYYRVFVGSDGAIHTEEVTVTDGEIEAGETEEGRQIVATSANIGDLNATTIKASEAIIGTIVTESLTAGKITANDALIASLTAPIIYATAIQALGNSLDLSANESIKLTVQGVRDDIDEVSGAAETALGLAESAQDAANGARTEAANAQVSADEANETAAAIQTELELTKSGLSVVQNETIPGLDGRVKTLESGVHISGAEIGIYTNQSPYRNTITNSGWTISENGNAIIECAETKLTAPRVQVTDAFIIGGVAWKSDANGHVRLLKYGR